MPFMADLKMYVRFALGLRSFLRNPMSPEESLRILHERLANREQNFLDLVRTRIYGYEKSPYRFVLEQAGCEFGDIEASVRSHGLEGALRELRRSGVYVGFEEFKSGTPIVRNGKEFPVQPHDFDNPYLGPAYGAASGGSTGAGTRVQIDLDHLASVVPYTALLHLGRPRAHETPSALWVGVLPAADGVASALRRAKSGRRNWTWFTTMAGPDFRPSLKNRLAMEGILFLSRLHGRPIPRPIPVPVSEALTVAKWACEALARHGECRILTYVSNAVRVCVAARENGIDLTGCTFSVGGEPPTPAKAREIERAGARFNPCYVITEIGAVGLGCRNPIDENDMHLLKDNVALVQHPRLVPGTDFTVDAFNFTTLLPSTPKIMLNVESDDYGVVETRACGCPLEEHGFTEHVRGVRSFRKLTSEAVTLVGNAMIRILEEVLPARFGGTAVDYQIMEEEDSNGLTRVSLLVDPTVRLDDEQAVIDTVLAELRKDSEAAGLAAVVWKQAGTLRVKRQAPIATRRGKLLPLHIVR